MMDGYLPSYLKQELPFYGEKKKKSKTGSFCAWRLERARAGFLGSEACTRSMPCCAGLKILNNC